MKRWVKGLAIAAAMVVGAWLIGTILTVATGQQESQRDRDNLHEQIDELQARDAIQSAALEEANRRLEAAGEVPVEEPVVEDPVAPEGIALIPGPRGPRGFSCIEDIGLPACRGSKGAPGKDSTRPGPEGEAGQDGAPGPQGPQGPMGPEGPRGEKGDPGRDGMDGKDGAAGQPGTARPGTYACPEGHYSRGFGVGEDGSVSQICEPVPVPANPTPAG
jgi:hypothetical protein